MSPILGRYEMKSENKIPPPKLNHRRNSIVLTKASLPSWNPTTSQVTAVIEIGCFFWFPNLYIYRQS
ncbi:hypothetical protein QL285_054663 [Trifolium repens]|nr:hypothetical protein QL285_054663 [Trifolium repens]